MRVTPENISAIIGYRIYELRREQKLSQEKLAFESDIHPAYLGKIERGEKCPTIKTLYKIARGLRVPLDKLLDISSSTELKDTDAFHRIKGSLNGLNNDEMLEVAEIVDRVTRLIKKRR